MFYHPTCAFWDIDFKLVIKKQKAQKEPLTLPLSCQREFKWETLLWEGSRHINLKDFHLSLSGLSLVGRKDPSRSLLAGFPFALLFLGCLAAIYLPRVFYFLSYLWIACLPFKIPDLCPLLSFVLISLYYPMCFRSPYYDTLIYIIINLGLFLLLICLFDY